jgi:hypothetical protein
MALPRGLRRFWPGASLLLGHRALTAMLPRRASPAAKTDSQRGQRELFNGLLGRREKVRRTISIPTKSMSMQITKQLAIFLDNRPGMLARVCEALAELKLNIFAISTSDTVDHSVIRMVVSDPRRAMLMFEERGTLVVEDDVLMIEGDNRPGSLANIAHRLGEKKINIEYCYCATSPGAKKGLLILRTADPKKALKVLNS